jgi:hypothetical protein
MKRSRMMITSELLLFGWTGRTRMVAFRPHMSKPDFFIVSGTLNDNITLVNGE